MEQALHIFRKDVRRLRVTITVMLALTAICAVRLAAEPYPFQRDPYLLNRSGVASFLIILVLALGWARLIVAAVHEEPLIGSRQFWLTRPYSWKSLLAAKCLLIVCFINLPVLVSDCLILSVQGLSPLSAIPNLFWRQVLLTGVLILPVLSLATITRHLFQFGVIAVPLMVGVIIGFIWRLARQPNWSEQAWLLASMQVYVVIAGTMFAAWMQYSRRRTLVACCALLTTLALWAVLPSIPIPTRKDNWPVQLTVSTGPVPKHPAVGALGLQTDIDISNRPEGTEAVADGITAVLTADDHRSWTRPVYSYQYALNTLPAQIPLGSDAIEAVAQHRASLDISATVLVFGKKNPIEAVPLQRGPFPVATLGACAVERVRFGMEMACRMTHPPKAEYLIHGVSRLAPADTSPYSLVFGASPVYTTPPIQLQPYDYEDSTLEFVERRLLVTLTRHVHIDKDHVADYLVGN